MPKKAEICLDTAMLKCKKVRRLTAKHSRTALAADMSPRALAAAQPAIGMILRYDVRESAE